MRGSNITVVVPAYNAAACIRECISSIKKQSLTGFSCLVVDDGSTDNTVKIITKEISADRRFKLIRNAKNLGLNRNFQKALDLVITEYCVFVGQDDRLEPDFIASFLRVISSNKHIDMYQPGVEVIDEAGMPYLPLVDRVKRRLAPKKAGVYEGERLATSLLLGNWLYFPSIIWRTATMKKYGFNAHYRIVLDLDLELTIIRNGGKLFFDREHITFQYRRHGQSESSKTIADGFRFNEEKQFFKREAGRMQTKGWFKAARAAKTHLTSRMYGLVALPHAMIHGGQPKKLIRHILK